MHGLELTPATSTPLIISAAAMLTTAARLVSAIKDRAIFLALVARGVVRQIALKHGMVRASVRREIVRVLIHFLTLGAIAASYSMAPIETGEARNFVEARNWASCAIAVLLMLNSVLDWLAQRRAMHLIRNNTGPPVTFQPQAEG